MNLNEKDTVLTLWTATFPPLIGPGDFLGMLVRRESGTVEGEYRLRYHREAGFEKGEDVISRYTLRFHAHDSKAVEDAHAAFRKVLTLGKFEEVTETRIDGDYRQLQMKLLELPNWAVNIRREEKPR